MSNRLVIPILAATFCACGHYRIGDPLIDKQLSLETVGVPADVDVDGGELTSTLVEGLRERGIDASWGKHGDVLCSLWVDHPTGFGVSTSPVATLRCELEGIQIETVGDSQANVGQEYRISTRNVLLSTAAQIAVKRMVSKIDQRVRRDHGE